MQKHIFHAIIVFAVVSFLAAPRCASQSNTTPEVELDGFRLKLSVSDLEILTGEQFSYHIDFTIPGGASGVKIALQIPSGLEFIGLTYDQAASGNPATEPPSLPPVYHPFNGDLGIDWGSAVFAQPLTGLFTVSVRYATGSTCPGPNNAVNCFAHLHGVIDNQATDLSTDILGTAPLIVPNPWNISKVVLGASTDADFPGCEQGVSGKVVRYRWRLAQNDGTTGQLDLTNIIVTDDLGQYAESVDLVNTYDASSSIASVTQTNNPNLTLTWSVNPLAANGSSEAWVIYEVTYAPGATSPQKNKVEFEGNLGSSTSNCGQLTGESNETCVRLERPGAGFIDKGVYTQGQPGCSGFYRILFVNNTGYPIPADQLVIHDPFAVDLENFGPVDLNSYAFTKFLITHSPTDIEPWLTLTNYVEIPEINPSEGYIITVPFMIKIGVSPGTLVENKVTATNGADQSSAYVKFKVKSDKPILCLKKAVCGEQPEYHPGDVLRFRIGIRNIGSTVLLGASITDVLDQNLEYLGNESFYSTTNWDEACSPTGPVNSWAPPFSVVGNQLEIGAFDLDASCQDVFLNMCDGYGSDITTVPCHFMEFDAQVKEDAAVGNIPNFFTVNATNLDPDETSNTVLVNVVGTASFTTETSFNVQNVLPGSAPIKTLRFEKGAGTKVALRHLTMVDLLPRSSSPDDYFIDAPCTAPGRGSSTDLSYQSTVQVTQDGQSAFPEPCYDDAATGVSIIPLAPNSGSYPNYPSQMFTTDCFSMISPNWTWGNILAGVRNVGWYFPAPLLPSSTNVQVDFVTGVSPNAMAGDVACNTFIANAAVRRLYNSTTTVDEPMCQQESAPACVTVEGPPPTNCCDQTTFPRSASVMETVFGAGNMVLPPRMRIKLHVQSDKPVTRFSVVNDRTWVTDGPSAATEQDVSGFFISAQGNSSGSGTWLLSQSSQANPLVCEPDGANATGLPDLRVYAPMPPPSPYNIGGPREVVWNGESVSGFDCAQDPICLMVNGLDLFVILAWRADEYAGLADPYLHFRFRCEFTNSECVTCTEFVYQAVRLNDVLPQGTTNGGPSINASIIMTNANSGTLKMSIPKFSAAGDDVHINQLEFESAADVALVSMKDLGSGAVAVITGGKATLPVSLGENTTASYTVEFDNIPAKTPLLNHLVLRGSVANVPPLPADFVLHEQDVVAHVRLETKMDSVMVTTDTCKHINTYALSFKNSNQRGEEAATVILENPVGAKMLALGPPSFLTDSSSVLLYWWLKKDESGAALLNTDPRNLYSDLTNYNPPASDTAHFSGYGGRIYLTVCENRPGESSVRFTSLTAGGDTITRGQCNLLNPMPGYATGGGGWGVSKSVPSETLLMKVAPANEFTGAMNAQLSSSTGCPSATLTLVTHDGREILRLLDRRNLPAGEHIIAFDIRELDRGEYKLLLEGACGSKEVLILVQ
ncbi:MAG: hypothetical protein M5R41_00855 [Bacteroidia bacterium]|nr:hypothetical protein [Bacteroidia bacterium]